MGAALRWLRGNIIAIKSAPILEYAEPSERLRAKYLPALVMFCVSQFLTILVISKVDRADVFDPLVFFVALTGASFTGAFFLLRPSRSGKAWLPYIPASIAGMMSAIAWRLSWWVAKPYVPGHGVFGLIVILGWLLIVAFFVSVTALLLHRLVFDRSKTIQNPP